MDSLRIATEDPVAEQWRLLTQYSYPSNIQKYMNQQGYQTVSEEKLELIAGSIRQSQAYFDAAKTAPLDISPLLLYYGSTNLLMASAIMMTDSIPPIENHGMKVLKEKGNRLADVAMRPINEKSGGLQLLSNVFSDGCKLVGSGTWTLGEILGSIPDIKQDFENQYLDLPYFVVPVEIVQTRKYVFERIEIGALQRYPEPSTAIDLILNREQAYLSPQYLPEYVILFRKPKGPDLGSYSISGQKFLRFAHKKEDKTLDPNQLMFMYMGLYILGFLPRYRPSLWNPFVRSDTTGEKFIIEKFTTICERLVPNQILSSLNKRRVEFVREPKGILDLTQEIDQDEIESIVEETIISLRARGEL